MKLSIKLSLAVLLALASGTTIAKEVVKEEQEEIIFISDDNAHVIHETTTQAPPPETKPPETTAVVQQTQPTPPETKPPETTAFVQQTQPAPQQTYFKAYRIHGVTPSLDWQKALYNELNAKGIAWYMPYAMCQIWQESCWNQWSDNGRDFGICQMKGIYWADRAAYYGVPGADIWNVYAQFHVYAGMMNGYLVATGYNVSKALSYYYIGTPYEYSQSYVDAVMSHWNYLEEIR